MVIINDFFLLFESIAFAVISFLEGLFLEVLLVPTRVIVAVIIMVATIVAVFFLLYWLLWQ